jgi:hypothetical protein
MLTAGIQVSTGRKNGNFIALKKIGEKATKFVCAQETAII